MIRPAVIALLLCTATLRPSVAQQVIGLSWPTELAADPVVLAGTAHDLLPAFRFSLSTLPETTIVQLALAQPELLGISASEAAAMQKPAGQEYFELGQNPAFLHAPTALSYCFSETKPDHGFATLYVPKEISTTRLIVFMHGFGGSFQWYLHTLAKNFPDYVILAPAYGILPYRMPPAYLQEAVAAAESKLNRRFAPPILIGLSAGVPPCLDAFCQDPSKFASLICIAGFTDAELNYPAGKRISLMAGENESYVASGFLARSAKKLQAAKVATELQIVPEADHFFLLTNPDFTYPVLKSWVKKSSRP